MKLFAPKYYEKFSCIKGECKNSCCVGWEIEVDGDTLDKYTHLPSPQREAIVGNIEVDDGRAVISTDSEGRCPFLTECGLCEIISTLGEEYISEICKRHPRFYNFLSDRCEVGLGASCEAAVRLILSSDEYVELIPVGDIMAEGEALSDFAIGEREKIFSILSKADLGYEQKMSALFTEYGLSRELIFGSYNSVFSELEFLSEDSRGILTLGNSIPKASHPYLIRFLAYLIYRHIPASLSYDNMRARIGFAILLTEIMGSAAADSEEVSVDLLADIAAKISEEIEYSEDNTEAIIFEIESAI